MEETPYFEVEEPVQASIMEEETQILVSELDHSQPEELNEQLKETPSKTETPSVEDLEAELKSLLGRP
jgi:hypothetical protein